MDVLLQIVNLHKHHGSRTVFDKASASFCRQQKIGVIGRNGAGKSTLCNIITGREQADQGTVSRSDSLRLSYLQQHDAYQPNETVLEFLMRHTGKQEWQCGKVAGRFQLKNTLLHHTMGQLSGGYRTRVKLTAMLLTEPNFLILDEPTNYLDLKTLILLEHFLQAYQGAFLIVSHDREFLKKTCNNTLEVENGSCVLYPGTVEQYLLFKEEQEQQAYRYNKNIEAKKKHLQHFIDRFGSKATKAKQAQSRVKQIAKLRTIEVGHPLTNVRVRIPAVATRKGNALCCDKLSIGYPNHFVAGNIDLQIEHGQHVAVLGDNGQGKTTFLRTLANDLVCQAGQIRWGHNTRIAYYAQHVFSALNTSDDIYTYLASQAAPEVTRQEILDLAGSFLFRGDDMSKKVSVLSGGEKARLCLAGLLLTKSNVLLLDEPTNHLDFETVEALGQALQSFGGTIFFISHDRTFVKLLSTHIIEVKSGKVQHYPGTYEEYVYRLATTLHDQTAQDMKPQSAKPCSKEAAKKIRVRMRQLEKMIAKHRSESEVIHQEFLRDAQAWSQERDERYRELTSFIESAEDQWLELAAQLE
ncbi:MAG: ABC-F family ATP-binding cassette domain-containing protein [Myxococcota bacterium]